MFQIKILQKIGFHIENNCGKSGCCLTHPWPAKNGMQCLWTFLGENCISFDVMFLASSMFLSAMKNFAFPWSQFYQTLFFFRF
jgi:hypothetical protein